VRLGVLICFEGIFPGPVREVCRKGAEALVITTSDAWAEGSVEVLQHSATATLRAVAARRFVIRAATTGRSKIVNPWGQIVEEIPAFSAGTLRDPVTPLTGLSLYHLWGDWPLLAILCACWLLAMLNCRRLDALP